jgi:hypothetical protein
MTLAQLEQRLAALEAEVARLKRATPPSNKPWWEQVEGAFAGDSPFEEAMRLGREYRRSLRPGSRKRNPGPRRGKGNGRS